MDTAPAALKMILASKMVKNDSKIVILICKSNFVTPPVQGSAKIPGFSTLKKEILTQLVNQSNHDTADVKVTPDPEGPFHLGKQKLDKFNFSQIRFQFYLTERKIANKAE